MKLFDHYDHGALSGLFEPGAKYAGYKPAVLEAPNGDGKIDLEKRYLHVALKYDPPEWARWYLARAHFEACRIAEAMNVPAEFYPKVENGTRADYPPAQGRQSTRTSTYSLYTAIGARRRTSYASTRSTHARKR
jgi:hypothetical protein